jgi:hypothetical protein
MLIHVHPGNQVAFFEIAATLIPLLLFGGIVADRVRPNENHDERQLSIFGSLIAGLGCYAVLAEAVAINAVVTGEWETWGEILVVGFVVGGMAVVVGALVFPWHAKLAEKDNASARRLAISTVLAILGIAGWGIFEMLSNVDRAGESQALEAINTAISRRTTEAAAVENRVLAVSIALTRARRQMAVANARDEDEAVLEGFAAELKALSANLGSEKEAEAALRQKLEGLKHLEQTVGH